ncbi:disintegrin and metalloproteinase domain-containing protein 15 isoform X4 [Bombina bombina]|uniref:disintegrin and metalloproteinase domain-containing protein 15 isoform X4 n=1 Tax=Bombina bombina TaxID=8345 RepID=UPI00235B3069|nr:disintegrin and metalloproteinase domain-containing protein 15 isoform X4 [Bombina bombina]
MRLGACWLMLLLCGLDAGHSYNIQTSQAHGHIVLARDSRGKLTRNNHRNVTHGFGVQLSHSRVQKEESRSHLIDETPYWEINPEIHIDGHRLSLKEAVQSLPSQLQLTLQIEETTVLVELHHSWYLLPASYGLTYYLPNGTRVTENSDPRNCYYRGHVVGNTGSWSSFSLCSGLSGVVVLSPDRSYSIEPIPGNSSNMHVLRPIRDRMLWNLTYESVEDSYKTSEARTKLMDRTELSALKRKKRNIVNETKYVELVMVADNSEFKMFHGDLKSLQTRMLEMANKVDAFYRMLNVRVVLVSAEVWNQKDEILVSTDPGETLTRFLAWREKQLLLRVPHDNAQLLTGVTFKGSAVGMATINSMCTADRSGGVNMDHSVSILGVASTMAHQLGHNLGITHDTVAKKCGNPVNGRNWIMEQSGGFMPGLAFSNCSLSDLVYNLKQGAAMCLYNVPSPRNVFGEPRCGNMLVEEGEQCDCGLTQECTDPCCNATSCQLVVGAECSSSGLCCSQCKLKPIGSLCREAVGECDLPEFCNGVSPQCSSNVFLHNGESCDKGRAKCYQGKCMNPQLHCQNLWGPGSSPAPETCFRRLNMRGDKYGNCGRRPNGTYVPCTEVDAPCGKIQCQGGDIGFMVGSDADIVTVNVTVSEAMESCQAVHFNIGDDVWDAAMVMTGTLCGEGKICVRHRCQDAALLLVKGCKNKCSGNGVCNSNNNCHCAPGWAPPDCASAGQGGSIDSGPLALEKAGRGHATTFLLVFLLFIPLVILLVFCYKKREFLHRRLENFSKGRSCQYRVTQTDNKSRPQRPPPPQRTQSTELQIMSATSQANYQGSERPEPPSKPLPPDPVKRQSSDRPEPPSKALPPDPVKKNCQDAAHGKPPLPRKPLIYEPLLQHQDPILRLPVYFDSTAPSRPAPPPPGITRTPRV